MRGMMRILDRRHFIAGSLASVATPALAAPLSRYGLDATGFGVRPNVSGDQTATLQRAVNEAAASRTPLMLAPGTYRTGSLRLSPGSQIVGVRTGTFVTFTGGGALFTADHSEGLTLTGLSLQGGKQALVEGRGLVHFSDVRGLRITDCTVSLAGGNAIVLEECDGAVTGTTITDAADCALFAKDSRGLILSSNTIRGSGNNGICVWQSDKRYDGTLVVDNRIEDTHAHAGGTGQYGNAISVFRAGNVIVRGNVIRRAAYSAIRGNSASNIQIIGNNCEALDEVAIYSEFSFEGAVIADNVVDGAENGVVVTNFDVGGRLASVHGNLLRNLGPRRPDKKPEECDGIGADADTAVTGNVVENATGAGIRAGWGPYLRNVTVSGNVVRNAAAGIAVSVVPGTLSAAITGNDIAGTKHGTIVGMEWFKQVADLSGAAASNYPQLTIANNRVR
jgi:uncharacterized secreted repeat protein (TIGR03808 family)